MPFRPLVALLLLPALLGAMSADIPPQNAASRAFEALGNGEYLVASAALHTAALDANCMIADHDMFANWTQVESFIAGETPTDSGATPSWQVSEGDIAAIGRATAHDALDEIAKRARDTRIVIVNEDHSVPRSRVFALQVARRLRPLGYDVLALETLTNDADPQERERMQTRLVTDGFVRRSTGTYTADPVFADYLRQALRLGYRPVAYEKTDFSKSGIADREQQEADNLVRNALNRYPHAKLLIHVGFAHLAEAKIGRPGTSELWMAGRLKQMTGIDPLTIDQTTFMEIPSTRPSRPIYPIAAPKAGRSSVVLFDQGKPLVVGRFAGAIDLQVVHPRAPHIAGRPGWLTQLGRRPVAAPVRLRPTTGTVLVQAFAAREPTDAIPLDQVLWTAGRARPSLMLPHGRVRFVTQVALPARCEVEQPR